MELRKSADWKSTVALLLPYSVEFGFTERWGTDHQELVKPEARFLPEKVKEKITMGHTKLNSSSGDHSQRSDFWNCGKLGGFQTPLFIASIRHRQRNFYKLKVKL